MLKQNSKKKMKVTGQQRKTGEEKSERIAKQAK